MNTCEEEKVEACKCWSLASSDGAPQQAGNYYRVWQKETKDLCQNREGLRIIRFGNESQRSIKGDFLEHSPKLSHRGRGGRGPGVFSSEWKYWGIRDEEMGALKIPV